MKKILSLLLVALMIVGMLPLNAIHAHAAGEYVKATDIQVGDTVVFVYEAKSMELTSISTTSTQYGVGTAYSGSPNGTMAFEVVAGSSTGTFAFKNNGKYLYWTSGNSLNVNATLNANTSWNVSFDSNGNAEVTNCSNTKRAIFWNSSSPRFACYDTTNQKSIQIYKLEASSGGESACEHTNTTTTTEDATCTAQGSITVTCDNCGDTVSTEKIAATGHNYVNGSCANCGEAEPTPPVKSGNYVIYTADGIAMTALALGSEYGYLAPTTVTVTDGVASGYTNVNIFALQYCSNGNYTIQDINGKYLYMKDTHNSFNVASDNIPAEGAYWKLTQNEDGTYYITNVEKSKAVGFDTVYNTFGSYSDSAKHSALNLAAAVVCEHANTKEETVVATCTKVGSVTVICTDCNAVVSKTESPMLDHTYVDGACSVCGAANVEERTYTFNDYTAGGQYAENEEHVLDSDVTMITTQCHFTTELRIYSSSTHDGFAIINSKLPIAGLAFNAGDNTDKLNIFGSNDGGTTWTQIAAQAVTGTYTDYTIDFGGATYSSLKLDVAGTKQVRLKNMTLTFVPDDGGSEEPECDHANATTTTVDATCTAAGSTTVECECGYKDVTEIPALGHNYVEGVCSRCGDKETVVVIPEYPETGIYQLVTDIAEIKNGGKFVVVANVDGKNYAVGTTISNSKLNAVEVDIINGLVYTTDAPTWIIGAYGENIVLTDGAKYLKNPESTDLSTTADVFEWVVKATETENAQNAINIISAVDDTRALMYRASTYNLYGAYKLSNNNNGEYYADLYLYELVEGELVIEKSTLSFSENGQIASTAEAEVGSKYVMPDAVNAAPEGYTFAGWVKDNVKETDIAPETIYAAGSEYKVGTDVTFYALYTRNQITVGGTVYQLVTDASALQVDDKVIIAGAGENNYALSTEQKSKNRGGVAITKSENILNVNNEVQILTLEKGAVEGTFAFYTGSGYLYAASSSGNQLKTQKDVDANASWAITIEDGDTSVIAINSSNRNVMQYNPNNGSPLFACYGSASQQAIALYKATAGTSEVTYYTTFVCAHSWTDATCTAPKTCALCGETEGEALGHTEVVDTAVAATCTGTGLTEGKHCSVCNEVLVAQTEIEALGHNEVTDAAVAPTLDATGLTEGKHCDRCGEVITAQEVIPALVNVAGWNLTLNDDISVNFTIKVSEDILDTVKLSVTVAGVACEDAIIIDENGACSISVKVAAAQMNDAIVLNIVDGENTASKTYTVKEYAKKVLADQNLSNYHQLVLEMLNYGAAAQTYFGYNAEEENLATYGVEGIEAAGQAEIVEPEEDMIVNDKLEGLNFYGASLVYRDKIAVRFYFAGSIQSINFGEYEAKSKEGLYYVEIANILPQNLDNQFTVTATDAEGNVLTVSYSPTNYIFRMSQKDDETLQNLMGALYNYHLAAVAYAKPAAQ